MKDTRPDVACQHHRLLVRMSVERRSHLLSDLYAFGRTSARAGIVRAHPGASEAEIQKLLFLRFYEHDLPQPLIDRVLRRIDERYAAAPARTAPPIESVPS